VELKIFFQAIESVLH